MIDEKRKNDLWTIIYMSIGTLKVFLTAYDVIDEEYLYLTRNLMGELSTINKDLERHLGDQENKHD